MACEAQADGGYRVRGRPHYYSYKKEEYAHIKFDLDAGMQGRTRQRAC